MKIVLIGYGKMGQAIERIALDKCHEILYRIDIDNKHLLEKEHLSKADVAIEFTGPESAYENIVSCFGANVPVVSGSTGWLDKLEEVKQQCIQGNHSFLYASNFSIGVNIFFELNKKLAELMAQQTQYEVSLEEVHHIQKKDAPSGTAITLAEQIIENIPAKTKWVKQESLRPEELSIFSIRKDAVPGTHSILYHSDVDDIEIVHTAHSRKGFASGALTAAEWLIGKKGVFGMKDVLGLE